MLTILKFSDDIQERKHYGDLTTKENVYLIAKQAKREIPDYFKSFFPIFNWLPNYNRKWILQDMIAGITVGIMLVPQSLAYAKLANLPLAYGLYTSFICPILYPLMGTSREVSVGSTAMLSLIIGSAITRVTKINPDFSPVDIAVALTFLSSIITAILGIFKLGIILDLIPKPVIMGFTSGAALTIILTQVPTLLGIPNLSSSDSTTTVIYNLFSNIPKLDWTDLVFGLCSLSFIFTLNFVSKILSPKYPAMGFLKGLSIGLTVLIFTIVSFVVFKTRPDFDLKIVKTVPQGFGYIGTPNLDPKLLAEVSLDLLPVILIGVLEHVALCKAFARQAGYQISSSQELFALGTSNLCASFFSAYPATGSFTGSAIVAQSGVHTPLASSFTGIIVLMAISFLTPAFFYIPNATLAAIIVVSASSLISSYKTVFHLWKIQPTDCLVFLLAAFATFFAGTEIGIGSSLGLAFLVLIYRIARPHLYLLSQVINRTNVFIDHEHPAYDTKFPLPGVLIFKPQESLVFPNIDYFKTRILDLVLEATKSGVPPTKSENKLWCEDLEQRGHKLRKLREEKTGIAAPSVDSLPLLKAIILDFGSVNLIDSSGLEGLFDIRDTLSKYAGVEALNKLSLENNKGPEKLNSIEEINEEFIEIPHDQLNDGFFEIHFVSTHPQVLKVLELSGITTPVATIVLPSLVRHLMVNNMTVQDTVMTTSSLTAGIEPIVCNASVFVHLTVGDTVKRICKRMAKSRF